MLAQERQDKIVDYLIQHKTATVDELEEVVGVSLSTLRRDLNKLDDKGRIEKIHGGARLIESFGVERALSDRTVEHLAAKQAVASYAASLIQPNQMIYVDGGSATLQLVESLPQQLDITLVTNGLDHAKLAVSKGIEVILLGGTIRPLTLVTAGTKAYKQLQEYNFDLVFLGVNGIHDKFGLTTTSTVEADLKTLAASRSRKTYFLADASKFNQAYTYQIDASNETCILTEAIPTHFNQTRDYQIEVVTQ